MKRILSLAWRGIRVTASAIGVGGRALVALIGVAGVVTALANYSMTQGSGTTFGSVVIGGTVHYAQMLLCDLTTPSQCAAVSASGAVKVDNSAVTQPTNQTQVGGTTITTGAGATGTGSPRVTAAQDTTTIAGSAPGTAGSPSANVVSVQGVASGTPAPVVLSTGSAVAGKVGIDQTTPGTTNAVSPGTLAGGATFVTGTTAAMTGTASTQVVAAVATKRLYILRIKCNNTSSTATLVQIQDGSAGTVLDTLAAGATYGGEAATSVSPMFWTTAGNGLFAQDVTTGGSVICTASGYSG